MFKRVNPFAVLLLSATLTGCLPEDLALELNGLSTDNTPPEITLAGAAIVNVEWGSVYQDPGFTAFDAEDGDITHKVLTDGHAVNTSQEGFYHVTYQVKDSGNARAKEKSRIVVVLQPQDGLPDPAPVDPTPVDPTPVDPTPVDPTPVDPTPVDPTPVDPVPEDPDPIEEEPGVDVPEDPDAENPPVVHVPAILSFKLIGFTGANNKEVLDLQSLQSGDVVDLSLMTTNLVNVMAVSADQTRTGSVHFELEGPVSINRYENVAIYTMAPEPENLDISENGLPVGDYTLSATSYALPDMNGDRSRTTTITFSVVEGESVDPTITVTPSILGLDFVAVADDSNEYIQVKRLANGVKIDLATLAASRVNVLAESENVEKTGSVRFSLSGPIAIDRVENVAEYTMADGGQHLSIDPKQSQFPVGHYTLSVTPFSAADGLGVPGRTRTVSFEVMRTPPVAPPVVTLLAVDDYFTMQFEEQKTFTVTANDTFSKSQASFKVVQYPKKGEAVMGVDGSFIYHPHTHGDDMFVYQVREGAVFKQAKVYMTILPPKQTSTSSFTAIKPSSDSRIIYVSSSQGNDANDCASAAKPCKSLNAAFGKVRAGAPDHVYLKRGDVWRGQAMSGIKSGRSASEPAVVAFYGDSGPRPRIEHNKNFIHSFSDRTVVSNIHVIGIHFDAYKLTPGGASFTGSGSDHANLVFLLNCENVLLEDNIFNHLEIIIQSYDGKSPKNFTLRRNIWTGAYINTSSTSQSKRPSNIYAAGVDGLVIEENVFDYGGWNPQVKGAGGNMYNHNLYLQASNNGDRVVVRNNIITRASSHGVQMRAGGLAEDNFFGRNAIGLLMGYNQVALKPGVKAHAINNVVTEGHTMIKGDAPCSGVNLCSSAVYGVHFDVNGAADWKAQGNIVHSRAEIDTLWNQHYSGLVIRAFEGIDKPAVAASGNQQWSFGSNVLKNVVQVSKPGLTLGDYYAHLSRAGVVTQNHAGSDNFDRFMTMVKSRELQKWDDRLSAKAVNNYIRTSFGK